MEAEKKMKLNLANKGVFFIYLLFGITILTAINNYYFYMHVKRSSGRNANQLASIIKSQNKSGCNNEIFIKNILNITKAFSKNAYYNDTIQVKLRNGKILWEKPIKSWDKVVKSDIEVLIGSCVATLTYKVSFDTALYLKSIVRSLTFSATDFLYDVYRMGIEDAIKEYKKYHAFYRSRPTIGFAIFTFIILWLYRKRDQELIKEQQLKEQEAFKKFQKELQHHEDSSQKSLEEIRDKLKKHQDKLSFDANKFIDFYKLDASSLGNKYRKTLEKVMYSIFQYHMNYKAENLGQAIYELGLKKIISDTSRNYANIIRLYGNIDSHYNDVQITNNEILALAHKLLFILDEINKKQLMIVDISKQKTRKFYDKTAKKWVEEAI